MSIEIVVETIAEQSGIHLLPDHRGQLRKKLDRLYIQIKEIGFFK